MTGHKIVDAIARLHLEGHLVPHSWHQHIRYTNQRGEYGDHLAKFVLADVIYWYRPTAMLEEATGKVVGWKKKFAADMLQRSYEGFASLLGASEKQIKEAIDVLRKLSLVRVEFRTVEVVRGLERYKLPNVMFIEPDPRRIAEITYDVITHKPVPAGRTSAQNRPASTPSPASETSGGILLNSEGYPSQLGDIPLPDGRDNLPDSEGYPLDAGRTYTNKPTKNPTENARRDSPPNPPEGGEGGDGIDHSNSQDRHERPATQKGDEPHRTARARGGRNEGSSIVDDTLLGLIDEQLLNTLG